MTRAERADLTRSRATDLGYGGFWKHAPYRFLEAFQKTRAWRRTYKRRPMTWRRSAWIGNHERRLVRQ